MVGLALQLKLMGLCLPVGPEPPKHQHKNTIRVMVILHMPTKQQLCVKTCLTFICFFSSSSNLCSNTLAELLKSSIFVMGSTFSPSPWFSVWPGTSKLIASQAKTNKSFCWLYILHLSNKLFSLIYVWSRVNSHQLIMLGNTCHRLWRYINDNMALNCRSFVIWNYNSFGPNE